MLDFPLFAPYYYESSLQKYEQYKYVFTTETDGKVHW